ncbi:MAG: hypothetical protein LBV73_03905 [Paraburkholderia sp.]|nr:hypothetical protein [Paraburkholderia sp.]
MSAETPETASEAFAEMIAEVAGDFAAAVAAHGVAQRVHRVAHGAHGNVDAGEIVVGERVETGVASVAVTPEIAESMMVAHEASFSECLKTCRKIYILRVFVKEKFDACG